jgi:hypothetical protein
MSRWTTLFASIALLAFSHPAAAQSGDLPASIELKPGAAATPPADQTAEDASSGAKTRQIVTESKDAPPADASKAGAAPPPPADAAARPEAPKEANKAPEPGSAGAPPAPPTGAASPDKKEAAAPAGAAPGEAPPPPEAAGAAPPPAPPLKPGEVVFAVQTELKRVGCDPGEIDGVWGGQSREALAAFGHFAKVDVADLAPTPEILAIIKGKTAIVCPIQAEGGEPPPPMHHGYGGGGYGGGGDGY